MKSILLDSQEVFPSKIVCIGRNYVEHIQELNNEVPTEPVIFIKPNSALSNDIVFNSVDAIHYEGEVCFLVKSGRLAAVGFGLDLTKRDMQSQLKTKGLPWERAKAFDHSAVMSHFVSFNGNVFNVRMELYINERLIQQAGYELMLHKPHDLLNEINSFMTLEDDDVIMTGTPKGVGAIKQHDHFVGKIFEGDSLLIEASWVVKI